MHWSKGKKKPDAAQVFTLLQKLVVTLDRTERDEVREYQRLSNISYLSRFVLILVTGCTTLRLQTAMGLEGPKGRMYISYMN